jgi:hypothetical protein
VTDYTRPLLLGYARRDLYQSNQHVERVKQEFAAIAKVEGYTMGSTYIEDPATVPAAFEALIESVNRYEISTVLLPEWRHLALVDDPAAVKAQFERVTGARFLLYDPAPELAGSGEESWFSAPSRAVNRLHSHRSRQYWSVTEPSPPLWRARPQTPISRLPRRLRASQRRGIRSK